MVTVEQLLQDRNLTYIPSGRDYLINCLNPEHPDKNPSMRIDKISGIGHCFSCGHKLNLFTYFEEAPDVTRIRVAKIKEKIDAIYSSMYGLSIPSGAVPWDEDYRNISSDTYKEFGAFKHKNFENRIVFPIKDATGKIVAFNGRHLFAEGTPRYSIYPAHVELPLFPGKINPERGTIVLVEGIFDALNLFDKGVKNVVAAMGVTTLGSERKGLNKEKTNLLRLAGVSRVIILFDGDEAGYKAARVLETLLQKDNFNVDIIDLPDDVDPGSLSYSDVERLKTLI